jgi:hypothetical protein
LLVLERYGAAALEWDAEVLRTTLLRDNTQLSNAVWTKICAVRVLVMSPAPWRQWEVFHWVCKALAGEQPNFTYLEEPELAHIWAGIDALQLLDPKRVMSGEVDRFVAATARHAGLAWLPAPFEGALHFLDVKRLRCPKCDAIHSDDGDIRCITCGHDALEGIPNPFQELRDETARLWAQRSPFPLAQALEGLPETAAGNAAYKLLIAWEYSRSQRKLLLRQLRTL